MLPVSVVILSHNRLSDLSKNLSLLLAERSSSDEFEIIVVDNNSTDGTKEFLIKLWNTNPEIKLVLNDNNLGVAGGRNSGFAMAKRNFIVALDDDTKVSCADLRRIPILFKKYRTAGIFAFRVIHLVTGEEQNPNGSNTCQVANHHGAGFAFRRSVYEIIGGIDQECNFGAEELDFAIRTYANGWQVLYIPEITVFHNNYKRDQDLDKFRRIRRVYNNVRVYSKYFPRWMAFRNGSRYLTLASRTWISNHGTEDLIDLFVAALRGYKTGRNNHQPIPDGIVSFYNSTSLRPEFGNVPIWYKFLNLLRDLFVTKGTK